MLEKESPKPIPAMIQVVVFVLDGSKSMLGHGVSGRSRAQEASETLMKVFEYFKSPPGFLFSDCIYVQLVAFSTDVKVVLQDFTPINDVDIGIVSKPPTELVKPGGTCISVALGKAYEELTRFIQERELDVNRLFRPIMILLSDGCETSDQRALLELAKEINAKMKLAVVQYGMARTRRGNARVEKGVCPEILNSIASPLDPQDIMRIRRKLSISEDQVRSMFKNGRFCTDSFDENSQMVAFPGHLTIIHYSELGDKQGEANALASIGVELHGLAKWNEAIEYFSQALKMYIALGDRQREAELFGLIGNTLSSSGRWNEAIGFHSQALDIHIEVGDVHGEVAALTSIGHALGKMGKWSEAVEHHSQVLKMVRELGDIYGEAETLSRIGDLLRDRDRDQALRNYCTALEKYQLLGDNAAIASVYSSMGVTYDALRRYDQASRCFHLASEYVRLVVGGEKLDKSYGCFKHESLAKHYSSSGDHVRAREEYDAAADIRNKELGDDWGSRLFNGLAEFESCEDRSLSGDFKVSSEEFRNLVGVFEKLAFRAERLGEEGNARLAKLWARYSEGRAELDGGFHLDRENNLTEALNSLNESVKVFSSLASLSKGLKRPADEAFFQGLVEYTRAHAKRIVGTRSVVVRGMGRRELARELIDGLSCLGRARSLFRRASDINRCKLVGFEETLFEGKIYEESGGVESLTRAQDCYRRAVSLLREAHYDVLAVVLQSSINGSLAQASLHIDVGKFVGTVPSAGLALPQSCPLGDEMIALRNWLSLENIELDGCGVSGLRELVVGAGKHNLHLVLAISDPLSAFVYRRDYDLLVECPSLSNDKFNFGLDRESPRRHLDLALDVEQDVPKVVLQVASGKTGFKLLSLDLGFSIKAQHTQDEAFPGSIRPVSMEVTRTIRPGKISFSLTSPIAASLPIIPTVSYSVDLETVANGVVKMILDELSAKEIGEKVDLEIIRRIGRYLFDTVLNEEAREALQASLKNLNANYICIKTDEVRIPWWLICHHNSFIFWDYSVGVVLYERSERIAKLAPPLERGKLRMAVILAYPGVNGVGQDIEDDEERREAKLGFLRSICKEWKVLKKLIDKGKVELVSAAPVNPSNLNSGLPRPLVIPVNADNTGFWISQIATYAKAENIDVFHVIGEGMYVKGNPQKNSIRVSASSSVEDQLTSEKIRAHIKFDDARRPFVFLNVCWAGQLDYVGVVAEGIVKGFINAGAMACLCPVWPVDSDVAVKFSEKFYETLFDETHDKVRRLGEVVRDTNRKLLDLMKTTGAHDVSWMWYALYGEPWSSLL